MNNIKRPILKKILFIAICFFSHLVSAQSDLGLKPNPVIKKDTRYTYGDQIDLKKVSTELKDFHRYNPAWKWEYPYLFLSNVGQRYKPLFFSPMQKIGLQHGFNQFDKYFFTPQSIKYYNTKTPFSDLYLQFGKNEEYLFGGAHAQNINPRVNVGVDYKGINSDGFTDRSASAVHRFSLFNWFHSKNKRYNLMAAFILNKLKNQENGGLQVDAINDPNFSRDLSVAPVNLNNASNIWGRRELNIQQTIYFGKAVSDTLLDTLMIKDLDRKHALTHTFNYKRYNYDYFDNQSTTSFYKDFFFDSTSTFDETNMREVSNEFKIENFFDELKKDSTFSRNDFGYHFFLKHKFLHREQQEIDAKKHDLILGAGIDNMKNDLLRFNFSVKGAVSVAPNYIGDAYLRSLAKIRLNEMMTLGLKGGLTLSSPSLRSDNFSSNHFKWDNNLKRMLTLYGAINFHCNKGDIHANLSNYLVKNYTYIDQDIDYQQYKPFLYVLIFRGSKSFDWRLFHLDNEIIAQYISNREVLRLPKFYFKQSFYYQGGFISGKLHAHLGFDIWYNTKYKTDSYNPALADFYLQDEEMITMYPIMDLFFRLQIKTFRMFFLLQHLNQGWFGEPGYYIAPNYAAQDRAIKFGVSWQFYD